MLREKRSTRKALAFLLVILLFWSLFSVAASALSIAPAKKYSYEQYREWVQSGNPPKDFLPYERWASFGDFNYYILSNDTYGILAAKDFNVEIKRSSPGKGYDPKVFVEAAPETLLGGGTFPLEEKGKTLVYERFGFYYKYYLRKTETGDACYMALTSISWVLDGSLFQLTVPVPEDGVVMESYLAGISHRNPLCTLLSPDATKRDILLALGYLEPDPLFETWEIVTIAVGGTVIAAGLVTLVVLLTKKKKPATEV